MKVNIKFKKMHEDVQLPKFDAVVGAGSDIYAYIKEDVIIPPHTTVLINTGFQTSFKDKYVALVYSRSGMAVKRNLVIAQGTAVIDSSYRGEWMIPLHNDSNEPKTVSPGERICQFILAPVFDIDIEEVDSLDETERGSGGFGSTGVK